ncbi:hypothetical protein GCM10025857_30410 [Alicyclobacillus contaminans]|nr:hypothetical protein GCM10025857_30410 [Alicyclobacillus contaminans]
MTKRCFVGLLGCGVVGSGVVQALASCRDTVLQRFGVDIEVVQIAVRHLERPRPAQVRREWLCDNWRDVVGNPRIDVVIEVMGGLHPAYEAVKTALSSGKSVITANKELLAMHGAELARIAQENRVTLLSEASVLGGVPVLHALQHYFSANRITKLTAIANGTSNYILTRMRLAGVSFPEALAEAQAAGYAEADPSFDVLGLDARSKLQILCQAAFHAHLDGQSIACEGIAHLDAGDLAIAETLGCRIRHVALAEPTLDGIRASVRPMLIPEHHPLFGIDGVNNALCIDADLVGQLVYAGPGAGGAATASAVVEDLVQLLTGGAGESQGHSGPRRPYPRCSPRTSSGGAGRVGTSSAPMGCRWTGAWCPPWTTFRSQR